MKDFLRWVGELIASVFNICEEEGQDKYPPVHCTTSGKRYVKADELIESEAAQQELGWCESDDG